MRVLFLFYVLLLGDLLEARVPHEAEGDDTVGELLVEVRSVLEAGADLSLHAGIEVDLHDARAVSAEAPAAADHIGGVDEVVEDVLVDGGGGAGALNLLELVDVVGALGDLALGDEEDLAASEALFELGGEGLLDLADEHDEAEGVEDEETLLAGDGVFEFLSGVDVEAGEAFTEGLVGLLELEESEGDVVFGGGSVRALQLTELAEVRLNGHIFFVREETGYFSFV